VTNAGSTGADEPADDGAGVEPEGVAPSSGVDPHAVRSKIIDSRAAEPSLIVAMIENYY
jgi:hypothetical protein